MGRQTFIALRAAILLSGVLFSAARAASEDEAKKDREGEAVEFALRALGGASFAEKGSPAKTPAEIMQEVAVLEASLHAEALRAAPAVERLGFMRDVYPSAKDLSGFTRDRTALRAQVIKTIDILYSQGAPELLRLSKDLMAFQLRTMVKGSQPDSRSAVGYVKARNAYGEFDLLARRFNVILEGEAAAYQRRVSELAAERSRRRRLLYALAAAPMLLAAATWLRRRSSRSSSRWTASWKGPGA